MSNPTDRFMTRVRAIARECGYAVAVHGSETRDLDLVAVPWTPEAVSADQLVARLCEEVPLVERPHSASIAKNPEPKPWGRLAWSLAGCPDHEYVDLSVAPRAGEPVPFIHYAGEARTIPDSEGIYPDCSPRCDVRGGVHHASDCPRYRERLDAALLRQALERVVAVEGPGDDDGNVSPAVRIARSALRRPPGHAEDYAQRLLFAVEEARDLLSMAYDDSEHNDSPGNMAYAVLSAALNHEDSDA